MSGKGVPGLRGLANYSWQELHGPEHLGTPILTKMLHGMLERMSEKEFPGLGGLANHLLGRNFMGLSISALPSSQRCCMECWRG